MILETKSKWNDVAEYMKQAHLITLGKHGAHQFYCNPQEMLHELSAYKFAAKLIGNQKRVLDVGCKEGLGTFVLAKECGFAKGIDLDGEAIQSAKQNFSGPNIAFAQGNLLTETSAEIYDAVVALHVLEENRNPFLHDLQKRMQPFGIAILGIPNTAHVPLERLLRNYFAHVFLFAANNEIIHPGSLSLAERIIAVGCGA